MFMKGLRTARWILAGLFFVMSAVYLAFGRQLLRFASLSEKSQIIPSAITVSIGAVLFWLVISFVYGRLYCSTVCPVGTLIDLSSKLRRLMPARRRRYRYRNRQGAFPHSDGLFRVSHCRNIRGSCADRAVERFPQHHRDGESGLFGGSGSQSGHRRGHGNRGRGRVPAFDCVCGGLHRP